MSDIEKVVIGEATLYRGDCLQVTEMLDSFDQCITDPPYEASMHTKDRMVEAKGGAASSGRSRTTTEAHNFVAMDEATRTRITELIVQKTSGWVLFFCQVEGVHYWKKAIESAGGKYRFTGVWVKPVSKPNFSGYSPGMGYECITGGWCTNKGQSRWNGGGRAAVWTANPENRSIGNSHTSIKPQKLMCELVGLFSDPGQIVFDPFMGSGSTGVAAVSMGRKFIGIEREPEYFEICCRRIEEAQKGLFHSPYVKTKARVAVNLIEEEPKTPKAAPKVKYGGREAATPAPAAANKRFTGPTITVGAPSASPPAEVPVTKKRFAAPSIKVSAAPTPVAAPAKQPLPDPLAAIIKKHGPDPADFGPWDDVPGSGGAVGLDVETFKNFFCINLLRFANGQKISFERSERSDIDVHRLKRILETECLITFNGNSYDMSMIALALLGKDNNDLKAASNRLIGGGIKYWEVEKELGIRIPKYNHVDLIEPTPAVKQGLKVLHGRLHGVSMIDLPYHPDAWLTREQMNVAAIYCFNDLEATRNLFTAMREPLALRVALTKRYGIDMRSKSDGQIGEAVIRKRVEDLIGTRVRRYDGPKDHTFRYEVPSFIRFEDRRMNEVVEMLRTTEFVMGGYGVEVPPGLKDLKVSFGSSTYSMGIGGLHSNEGTRGLVSNEENVLVDMDVTGHYPNTIMKLGLYPKALGPKFLTAYGDMIKERADAKALVGVLAKSPDLESRRAEFEKAKVESEGGKIANNSIFGKLLSEYSVLFAPHIGIATTLTGQLSVLMFIEQMERSGIPVVSGNTDGVVAYCPRTKLGILKEIVAAWESQTGFAVESTTYKALYNSSVNTYIAIKEDGRAKRKGPIANPWAENDLRGQMMKNPQMNVLSDAVLELILNKTPLADTIRARKDPRDFVTVINVKGGGLWRGQHLGKVVRYYWSTDSDPIMTRLDAAGKSRKVAKTDGCRPLMELPADLPADIDYERYESEAMKIALNLGAINRREGALL